MPELMPLQLVIAWSLFFGWLSTHQRHAAKFKGESQLFLLALQVSLLIGSLVGLGLLVYYYILVAWYWPIVLFIIGSLAGGLVFGFLEGMLPLWIMSLVAFVGWPASAAWVFLVIRDLTL